MRRAESARGRDRRHSRNAAANCREWLRGRRRRARYRRLRRTRPRPSLPKLRNAAEPASSPTGPYRRRSAHSVPRRDTRAGALYRERVRLQARRAVRDMALGIKKPAVIAAAYATLFHLPIIERRAAMRAARMDEAGLARPVSK